MSEIAETASVSVLLADYAQADGVGKLNILGGGWQVTRLELATGLTAAMSLLVTADVPPAHYGEQFSLEIALLDESGDVALAPGPAGSPSPIRVSQIVKVDPPVFPGHFVPAGVLWAHTQHIINFPGGLPLTAGRTYRWQVRIDGDSSRTWTLMFHVAGPPPSPVLG